ncbi:alpha/beta hydrolase [uncultured Vagococcus sp.]|uniref:alpha/beta hydrolase n=1 Tax=uncultured Vagococcus sp. TaxID=189676 RepID=UPI0028D05DA9|nr:alpha/beta hydrolase [uncultured Vagococcus sp.]
MKKGKIMKRVLIGIGILFVLIVAGGLTTVKMKTYQPEKLATDALKSEANVKIEEKKELTIFTPKELDQTVPAIIFYQGALVKAESYSYLAKELATQGYPVYLLHHLLNLPILEMKAGDKVVEEYDLDQFVVGGHSLGGVVASRFAKRELTKEGLKGVFFLASYPDEKGDLRSFEGGVLSLTGTNDKVLNWSSYEDSQKFLPKQTVYQSIEGGNHGGFGAYGQQKGDGQPEISTKEQQDQIVSYLVTWLKDIE